jgi:hypothetical protein
VPAADTEGFVHGLEQALSAPGPHLIEAMGPPSVNFDRGHRRWRVL